MTKLSLSFLAALAVCAAASADIPQYTAVALHPAGYSWSLGKAGWGGQQVGGATTLAGYSHAILWTGTAGSAIDLDPGVGNSSFASATDGEYQGGATFTQDGNGFYGHAAAMWHGSAASYVSMAPPNTTQSSISDMSGGIQVGNVTLTTVGDVGGYWTGTADSFTPLLAPGFYSSQVSAVRGHLVVGDLESDYQHATVWDIQAGTSVDVSPAGFDSSLLFDTDGLQHAGAAAMHLLSGGFEYHAGVWDAVTNVFTDLNPAGSDESYAYSVGHGIQVGYAHIGDLGHAAAWAGTPGSYVDLHQYLPNTATSSMAFDMDDQGNIIGIMVESGIEQAVMWVPLTPPPPPSDHTFDGFKAPLNDPAGPESSFKAGRTLPVKFTLRDSNGAPVVSVHPTITLERLSGGSAAVVDVSLFGKGANDGANFRLDAESGQFIFNLSTKALQPGQYRITATIPETNQTHSVTFTIEPSPSKGGKG